MSPRSNTPIQEVLPPENKIQFIGAAHPLKTQLTTFEAPEGLTVKEILDIAQPDPVLLRDAVVFIDDMEITRDYWHVVRPKAGRKVTARIIPFLRGGGGGGGGGKNPLRTVLTIAVIAASFYFGPQLGTAITGLAETSYVAIGVGAGLISIAGSLLVNAVAPVPAPNLGNLSGAGGNVQDSPALFIEGARNAARPFEVVPSVLGFYRFKPALGASTQTEVLGDSNRLRMLLAVGLGELELSDWEIGNTPIEDFDDFELEVREGTGADAPLTIYTNQVTQDEFSIALTEPAGFQQRTSALDADELSVDITFPQGLVTFTGSGNRTSRTVMLEVQWRKVGDITWLDIPAGFTSTLDDSAISGSSVTFTAAKSVAVRHGIRWPTGERAQYEVQVRRTTADTTSTQIFDNAFWATLRTITDEDPIQFGIPLAKAALDIRATDQLNGLLEDLSVLAKSVVLDWDSGSMMWIERVSNNPASLFRHVLQGPGKAIPTPDAEIDLEKLQEWHEFCDAKGFTFNMVRDFSASIASTLADIVAAGRAGLDNVDGKWSVVIDEPTSITTTHISPRNSSGFEAEKSFIEAPHGWIIRFPNEDERYKQDTRTVYRDGFDETNATLFETMEFPGVTNADQIWKLGRHAGAVAVQRPERWTITQDFEALIARRGSRVKISHDILLVGLASGRIISLTTNGGGDVDTITVDVDLTMTPSNNYGLSIRRDVSGDVSLSVQINTVVGDNRTVTPTVPIPSAAAPEVGDLFSFGEFGQEVEDALVLVTEFESDYRGRVALVPYRGDEIYNADSGTIPPYVPTVTEDVFLPAVAIKSVITDESALEVGVADVTLVRAEFQVVPIDDSTAFLEVQQRFTGTEEPYYPSDTVQQGVDTIFVKGLATGDTWDFRVRWNHPGLLPGAWTTSPGVLIVGFSTEPAALINPTINAFGQSALIRWDEPAEIDVRFGGIVQFRHSQSVASPSWSESVSIGQVAQARSLIAILPLKSGTYFARVFDSAGNKSDVITLTTEQASVLEYADVDSLDEAPTFSGTHTNTVGTDSELKLDGSELMDSFGLMDDIPDWDSSGGVALAGTYDFATGFDLGSKTRVRLTTRITSLSVNVIDTIDERLDLIDTWEDFDGTDQAEADVQVWVRVTDDDPAGSPVWSEYQRLESSEYENRGFDFQARLFTNNTAFNIIVTELGVDVEELV